MLWLRQWSMVGCLLRIDADAIIYIWPLENALNSTGNSKIVGQMVNSLTRLLFGKMIYVLNAVCVCVYVCE